jgi:hypothetical protein
VDKTKDVGRLAPDGFVGTGFPRFSEDNSESKKAHGLRRVYENPESSKLSPAQPALIQGISR